MKIDPLAIFEGFEDYVSWDKYQEQVDLIEELTAEEKRCLNGGIRYLHGLLGERLLESAAEESNPVFFWSFRNAAPHAKRSLIRLAEGLKAFEVPTASYISKRCISRHSTLTTYLFRENLLDRTNANT